MSSLPRQRHQQIDDQATAWFALLRGDSVSVEQHAEFAQWLASEHEHQLAFDELVELWSALEQPLKAIASDNVVQAQQHRSAAEAKQVQPIQAKPASSRAITSYALAASAVLAVASGILVAALSYSPVNGPAIERLSGLWDGLSTPGQHGVTTKVGEQRNLELTDGSEITLNTQSSLAVTVDDNSRQMTLASGQAYFAVAKDESRPFSVTAGAVTATAIGTAFSVSRVLDAEGVSRTTVVVSEGIVDVTSGHEVLRLEANQQAVASQGGIHTSPVHADSATAWRHGQLIYSDVPLATIITDLNRYLPYPMSIGDDELAAVKVSAVLQLSEQADMLDALSHALPMRWQLMSESLVIIQPTSEFNTDQHKIDEA